MRDFLKGLDLDKETIDTIMAEHGKYLTGLKENNEELKKKVEGNEKTIKDLNSTLKENEKKLENLEILTNENKSLKAQNKMNDSNVKKEFSKFVASEVQALVNDDVDFDKALETYKKDNPQYFGETVVKKVQTSPNLTGGKEELPTTNSIMNDILRGTRN